MSETRELAKIIEASIGEVYSGIIGLRLTFHYESGFHQCFGPYVLDAEMVIRVMGAIGVVNLKDAVGRSCWVTHSDSEVSKIEPLHEADGKPFVVSEWQAWVKTNRPPVSYSELAGGDR